MRRVVWGLTVIAALCVAAAPGWGQTSSQAEREAELRAHPGYVDFGDLMDFSDGEEVVDVYLTQPLLGLTSWLVKEEDPELADMFKDLKLVKANVFSFDPDDADALIERADEVTGRLEGQGWQRIVRVSGRDERLTVFLKMRDSGGTEDAPLLDGVVVVALNQDFDNRRRRYDSYEAVLVNIVGVIDFGKLSALGKHLDIPHLEDIDDDDWRRDRDDRDDQDRDDDEGGR